MVYKIPPGGGGKPYLASGLYDLYIGNMLQSSHKIYTLFGNICIRIRMLKFNLL